MGATISNPPCFQRPSGGLYLIGNQLDLQNGVSTIVELSIVMPGFGIDEIEDTVSYFINPVIPGIYLIKGSVVFTSVVADKEYSLEILMDGGIILRRTGYSLSANDYSINFSTIKQLSDNEIKLAAVSLSGDNTVDIRSGANLTFLILQRIR